MKTISSKWDVINKTAYPTSSVKEFDVLEFMPTMKVVEYQKNNIALYYFKQGTLLFLPADWDMEWGGIYKVFRCVIKTIENIAPKNKMIGFQLCELEQLNTIVQYMIKRNGYSCYKKNGILIVDKL